MNKSILQFIVIFGMLVAAMLLVSAVFTGYGNKIGTVMKYFTVGVVIFGVASPIKCLYFLVPVTAYLDLLKRTMIFDDSVSQVDLVYVLAFAPVMVVAMVVGILLNTLFSNQSINKSQWLSFYVSLAVTGLFSAVALVGGLSIGTLRSIANDATYVMLIFVIGVLLFDRKRRKSLWTLVLLTYVPVSLYAIKQSYSGLSDFELLYLQTGLSLEARQLDEDVFRPFSTLNAASTLSVILSVSAAACLGLFFNRFPNVRSRIRVAALLLFPIFAYGAYLTLSRGGWFCGVTAFIGLIVFNSRIATFLSYLAGVASIALLMIFSGYILKNDYLSRVTTEITAEDADAASRMSTRLGTFSSRLISMEKTMTEPRRWRPFGVLVEGVDPSEFFGSTVGGAGTYYVHDGFSEILLRAGYVPLVIITLVGSILIVRFHKGLFLMRVDERKEAVFYYALLVGTGVGFLANSAQLRQFPINTYFYLMIGACWAVCRAAKQRRKEERNAPSVTEAAAEDKSLLSPARIGG